MRIKRILRRMSAVVMMLTLSVSLIACGGKDDGGGLSSKKKTSYTLSEYMKKDDLQIWYIGGIDKDREYKAIIFKGGKCTYVGSAVTKESKYPTLGDAAQATDEEIYDALLEAYQTYYDSQMSYYKEVIDKKEQYDWEDCEKKYNNLIGRDVSDFIYYDYLISVEADKTGNNTEEEMFTYYQDGDLYYYYGGVECGYDIKPYNTVQGQVYDSYYKGFEMYESAGDMSGDRPFFTRVDSSEITISVDTPTTKGVLVDKTKDEIRDMLKEKLGIKDN